MSGFANAIRLQVIQRLLWNHPFESPLLDAVAWLNLLTTNPTSDGQTVSPGLLYPVDYVEWGAARKALYYAPTSGSPPTGAARWQQQEPGPGSISYTTADPIQWESDELTSVEQDTLVVGLGLFTRETGESLWAWDRFDEPIPIRTENSYIFPTGEFKLVMQGQE